MISCECPVDIRLPPVSTAATPYFAPKGAKATSPFWRTYNNKTTLPTQKCGLFIGFFLVSQSDQIIGGEVIEFTEFHEIVDF